MEKIIWVLKDDRAGNYSQALGLADKLSEEIPCNIQIKNITYNSLSKLPNFFKVGLLGIDKTSRESLLNQNIKPDIIISAGRKTAPIAVFLKKNYQAFANPLIIQIMNPNLDFSKFAKFSDFDFVILPTHDKPTSQKNVIRIIGALTRIKDGLLDLEYQKFANILEKISSPKIALLVGGSSKKGKFTNKIAEDLGKIISKITNQMSANLLILNSRRTGREITEILDQNLNCAKVFFKWQKERDWKNPYFAVLKAADFIVVTGDSISMCSEICSLGKPVYIFNPREICSSKHLAFHQNLFDQNFAKRLDENTIVLENFFPRKLEETRRVARLIADNLG